MGSTFKEKPRGMMEILSPFINEFSQWALVDFLAIPTTLIAALNVHNLIECRLALECWQLVKCMVPCNSFGWKSKTHKNSHGNKPFQWSHQTKQNPLGMHSSFGKMSRPHTQTSSTWQCPINITIWKLPPNTTQPKDTQESNFPKKNPVFWFTRLMFINGMETFVCIPSCLIINKETSFLFCHK